MSPKSKLSTHFLAIALISATSSLFQLSFCGDSAILSNRKSSLTSLSDSEERPLPNRSDKNLSSRSRTSPARDHYFDRYFDRSRDRSGGGGRRERKNFVIMENYLIVNIKMEFVLHNQMSISLGKMLMIQCGVEK